MVNIAFVDRKCLVCQSPAETMREYCSDECYKERKRFLRRVRTTPICVICSREFVRSSNRQKTCAHCRIDKTRLYTAQYNTVNQDEINRKRREEMRRDRAANPKKFHERNRKWWSENREEIKARRSMSEAKRKANDYLKRRYRMDPTFAVSARISSAIYQALRRRKGGRKWEDLVGYTCVDLTRHLERQFVQGMTWDNMGEWHIDHIVPKSSFHYTDESDPEFKACWALTNLRPLWKPENQAKHSKREFLL